MRTFTKRMFELVGRGKFLFMVLVALPFLTFPKVGLATYSLPNNDADCPGNCRTIPWNAGSDQWNGGTLPVWGNVTCTGLTEGDGTTNNATAIQTCINNAAANKAVLIPAGIYYVNGTITLKDNVVLRGAGFKNIFLPNADPTATTLKLGTSGQLSFSSSSPTRGAEVLLATGNYQKGTYTLTTATNHGLAAGDWFVLYEHQDPTIPVSSTGANGLCSWCGEDDGVHMLGHYNKVVSVGSSTQINILLPLRYTFKSTLSAGIKKVTWSRKYAGMENMRINGWSASKTAPMVSMYGTLYSWVKNVELYNDYNSAKAFHIYVQYSHGNEIRDSYIHTQRAQSSDRAYGIGFFFSTSDNKIENNIIRELRHGSAQEGGGSGNVWLYNYIDDIYYKYDTSIKENPQMNHGAHPLFTFWEGNISTGFHAEYLFGSSSHGVLFRNHFWGDLSGNYPEYSGSNPDMHFIAVLLDRFNNYYSLVGNVLGKTGLHTSWSGATLHPTSCSFFYGSGRTNPTVYGFGCDEDATTYNSNSWDTSIKHGNYDYKTLGVAHWDGGADHTLAKSIYYGSQPGSGTWWCTETPWPPIGPDVSGYTNDIPAKRRYDRAVCTTGSAPPPGRTPLFPVIQRVQ